MGTWGAGVFENDAAEDLLEKLDLLGREAREELLKSILVLAVEPRGALGKKIDPAEVLAGVAVVAVSVSGDSLFSGAEDYPGMKSWVREGLHSVFRDLSLQALDFIEYECDWYWVSWLDEAEKREAVGEVLKMRKALSP